MAVTRVGSTSGVNTATLPAHQAGDLILVFTFTDGSATIPTLVGGYTSLGTATVTTIAAARIAYKYATSSSETLGTWTSATALVAHVYRGAILSPSVGTANIVGNANSAYAFGSLPMYGPGTSWVCEFFAHVNTDVTLTTAAEGPITTVVNYSDATNKAWSGDTNGAITGWPTSTPANVTGTVGAWVTAYLEICDIASVLGTPVLRAATGSLAATHTTASFTPAANETLFVAVSATHGSAVPAQPTISDSVGLTWTEIDDTSYNTGSAPWWRQRTFWANVGSSPVSMTVSGASTSATGVYVNAVGMTGCDPTTPAINKYSATNAAGDGTVQFTLSPNPMSCALLFACYTGAVAITPPTGYTELFDGQPQTTRTLYTAYDSTAPAIGPLAFSSTNTFGIYCGFEVRPANLPSFTFRSVSTAVANASGNATFTEPAGGVQGDLYVACLCIRDTPAIGMPAGWTQIQQQNVSDANITANGNAGLVMAYIVRGSSAPDLVFTRTAGDLIYGVICAYAPKNLTDTITFDTSQYTAQGNVSAISMTGLTTAAADELIVGMSCSGRALGANNYDLWGGTNPNWYSERFDGITATGGDGSLAVFDGTRSTAGATGTVTGTSVATNLTNRDCLAAFRLAAAATAKAIPPGLLRPRPTLPLPRW